MRAGHAPGGARSSDCGSSASTAIEPRRRELRPARILELNNRAHRAHGDREGLRLHPAPVGFPQVNIDLIAGMVGETEENWQACTVQQHPANSRPESVTIYQMRGTVQHDDLPAHEAKTVSDIAPIADWDDQATVAQSEAFARLGVGRILRSAAPTPPRCDESRPVPLPRRPVHRSADLLGLGVASFAHLGGVHAQNEHGIGPYVEARVQAGELPVHCAPTALTDEERLIREFIAAAETAAPSRHGVLPSQVRRRRERAVRRHP